MSKRHFLKRAGAIGAAAVVGGAASVFTSRSHAIGDLVPEAGGRLGDAVGELFGDTTNQSIKDFLEKRNEETGREQDDQATVVPSVFDAMNHVDVTRYNQRVMMETEPLPDECETTDHRYYQQAHEKVEKLSIQSLSREYDRSTLTIMAPYYNEASRSRELRERFGDDWVEVTSSAAHLFNPEDINQTNSQAADAFILNATSRTSKNLARFTHTYTQNNGNSYADASAIAAYTAARLPLVRQRNYITSYDSPSQRTNMHSYVESTLHNQAWRDEVRNFATEVQGMQMLCKQKAYENFLKLQILRELELKLLLESHNAAERIIISIQEVS